MEAQRLNFGKAIYLGVDPLVAVCDGFDGFDSDDVTEGWMQVEEHFECSLDTTLRSSLLTTDDKNALREKFHTAPEDARLFKLMPQSGVGFKNEGLVGILCLREYAAGGAIVVEQIGRIWSKPGRLIIVNSSAEINLEPAVSESFYFVMRFK